MSTIVLAVKMQSGYTALIFFFFFLICIVDISLAAVHVSTTEIFLVYILNEKDKL